MKNFNQSFRIIAIFAIMTLTMFMAACDDGTKSTPGTVATPTATPAGGNYTTAQDVTLTTTTAEADIHYTLDGTTPSVSSDKYLSPITISTAATLKAIAVKSGMTDSDVLTAQYTITPPNQVAQPTATPSGGNYTTAQTVTLSTTTARANIHYTLNGVTPTASSAKYSNPITISTTTTLKAIAIRAEMTNSYVLTETYTITASSNQVAQPTATPAGGNYTTAQTVTLATTTAEADIHYTLNGDTPTASSAKYASPITVSATTTLKAVAVKTGMTDSAVLTATYTITTPTFTVAFNADGGTPAPTSPVSMEPGSTVTQPSAMTKAWCTFGNWYTDSERTILAVFPITVTDNVNLYAKWIVNTLTSVADVSSYLASLPNNTSDNPASLPVNFNLGVMTDATSGWRQLLDAINTSGKYVNLDLSACTMSGNSFNPDGSVATGKDKIVSLVLPAAAMSIEVGTLSNSTFKNFSNLKSISGTNVFTIGNYAFFSWSSSSTTTDNKNLQSIDFPQATSIGNNAFIRCISLQNVNLPQATDIGYSAFSGCTGLESVSFPASVTLSTVNPTFDGCTSLTSFTLTGSGALSTIENGKALVRNGTELVAYPSASGTVTMNTVTSIGNSAFYDCIGLQSVGFPQVISIGDSALRGCTNLQGVYFPQATSISKSAFSNCSSLQSADFPQVTSIGSQAFWSCSGLQSLNIPKVTSIGSSAFSYTGTTPLVITMGAAAPTLGYEMFYYITSAKTVTVKVSSFASGYTPFSGSTVTVSGTSTTANWANGLRGGGWNGTTWDSDLFGGGTDSINQNITVIIEVQ